MFLGIFHTNGFSDTSKNNTVLQLHECGNDLQLYKELLEYVKAYFVNFTLK